MEPIPLARPLSLSLGALVNTRASYNAVATVYGAIAIAVFALAVVLTVVMLLRYRARVGGNPPSRVDDAPKLELMYVLALGGIAAFLVAFTFIQENKSDAALAKHPGLVVRVTAAKWHWSFFYPGLGLSELGTDSSPPTLFVPRGENIDFRLTSADVIHAFWIPLTDFKRAAYPGYTQDFVLSFDKDGFVRNAGACAEFCGLLHAEMRFNVDVMEPARFARWAAAQRRSA